MVSLYALVDAAGRVVNVLEYDADKADGWTPPKGTQLIADVNGEAEPGGTYDAGTFTRAVRDPAFLAGSTHPPEVQRRIDIAQRAEVADQIQRLNSATPEQIETWVNANMTTLAQARVVIATILKILAARL